MKIVSELKNSSYDMRKGVSNSEEQLSDFRQQVAHNLANKSIKDDISITRCGNSLTFAIREDDKITVYQTEAYKIYKFLVQESQFVFENVEVYEGKLTSTSFVYNETSNPKSLFTIPDVNIDTSSIKVSVTPNTGNTYTEVWNILI